MLALNDSGNISIRCTFTGYLPSNFTVVWKTNETVLLESNDTFSILTSLDGPGFSQRGGVAIDNGITSVLTISSLTVGKYNFTCYMINSNLQGSVKLTAG